MSRFEIRTSGLLCNSHNKKKKVNSQNFKKSKSDFYNPFLMNNNSVNIPIPMLIKNSVKLRVDDEILENEEVINRFQFVEGEGFFDITNPDGRNTFLLEEVGDNKTVEIREPEELM